MTQGCASSRIFAFFQIVLANLVTNVASVAFNLSLVKISWFLINDVVPRASVDVVNDVVKLDSAIGQIGRPVGVARVLTSDLLLHFNFG